MSQLHECYGLALNPLYPRLEKTKKFTTGCKDIDLRIDALLPSIRNQLLNFGIGIEIEIENVGPARPHGWVVVADGSLRNNGLEFKTAYGHRVWGVYESVDSLQKLLKESYKPSFSERTSVHVHMDVRTLTLEQLHILFLVYLIFEDSLFRFAGEKRKHNIFCTPFLNSSTLHVDSEVKISSEIVKNFIEMASKYTAFNLSSIREFGTVEFRHMEGNYDPERIFKWVCLLGLLKTYSKSVSVLDLERGIINLKSLSHFQEFGKQVFGSFADLLEYNPLEMSSSLTKVKLLLPEN